MILPFQSIKAMRFLLPLAAAAVLFSCTDDDASPNRIAPTAVVDPNAVYTFADTPTWSDEFNYTGAPDASKWTLETGGGGWGNNEVQFYTNSTNNARVEGGNLIVEARRESMGGRDYSSARLNSVGTFTYGKIVARVRLPQGKGTWPAFWMLAKNQSYGSQYWPDNGEIDVLEHVGYDPGTIHGSVHTAAFNHVQNTQKTASTRNASFNSSFHEYAVEWTPARIDWYLDGVKYFSFANTGQGYREWPFDKPFFLLLNIAIGGNWGGVQGVDDGIFPQRMEVDYVRVYNLIP